MIWVVSEDSKLATTLGHPLRAVGDVATGPPETGHWKEREAPDLVVLLAADVPGDALIQLERALDFLRHIPRTHLPPAPVLYVESVGRRPSATLVGSLIDDRPFDSLTWPLDPGEVTKRARRLLEERSVPPSLRERHRRAWVTEWVERLYAGIDLASLRRAIAPRNAAQPVLFLGEAGTRHALLARYVHNLAEPAREELVVIAASQLQATRAEEQVLDRCAGRRVTVLLDSIDAVPAEVQSEIAQLVSESGALGIEPIRWIASATDLERMPSSFRGPPWIQVALPALRERPDLGALIDSVLEAVATGVRRQVSLDDQARQELLQYLWPGNLRELEAVLSASVVGATGAEISVADLRFAPRESASGGPAEPARTEPEGSEAAAGGAAPRTHAAEDLPRTEREPEGLGEERPAEDRANGVAPGEPALADLLAPLAQQMRQPLLAVRTYTSLLDQRPEDPDVRRELAAIVDGDLFRVEVLLQRLERFVHFGTPRSQSVDLSSIVTSELDRRQPEMQGRGLVVLRELDLTAAPALADEEQLRFSLGCLLDCALRMIPDGGDLYVASLQREADAETPAGHRLLIRFHSPEDVLVGSGDLPGSATPIEVVLARTLISRMGGEFAADAAGSQDNLVLIELPSSRG